MARFRSSRACYRNPGRLRGKKIRQAGPENTVLHDPDTPAVNSVGAYRLVSVISLHRAVNNRNNRRGYFLTLTKTAVFSQNRTLHPIRLCRMPEGLMGQ